MRRISMLVATVGLLAIALTCPAAAATPFMDMGAEKGSSAYASHGDRVDQPDGSYSCRAL
jgi:hypothetical protein